MNKTITKNLRKLRQGKRLTQEYVAERLGVSAKAVSRWEKGNSTPDMEKLIAISDMFENSLDELVMDIVYIKHNNLTAGTRTFKPNTKGAELVPELSVVSEHIFVKTKSNALTSEDFTRFITDSKIDEFFICGADATACVKSTSYNMAKSGFKVHVISDCITSYDLKKIDEMLEYYGKKGCDVKLLDQFILD